MDMERMRKVATLLNYEIKDLNFKRLVDHVLQRIPDRYEEGFLSFSIYQRYSKWGAHVYDNNVYFDVKKLEEKSGGDEDVKIGFIAHELAHVFLNHTSSQNQGRLTLKHEDEADEFASMWGFAKEIKAFRQKIGPPAVEEEIDIIIYTLSRC